MCPITDEETQAAELWAARIHMVHQSPQPAEGRRYAAKPMIDWQVQVDGQYPADWDQHRDGCWFPDFAHQEYMLPYFDVGCTAIDPYDGTEFTSNDLEKLRDSLENATDAFTKPPRSLRIPEHLGYGSTVFSPDPKIMLPIVKRTLAMVEYALANNGTLVFRGD